MLPPMILVSWRAVLVLGLFAALFAGRTARPDAEATPVPTAQAEVAAPSRAAESPAILTPETLTVEMTAYTSVPAQTDGTPHLTASGAPTAPGTVAVSRDLLGRFPYGSQLEVVEVSGPACGGFVPDAPLTVADTMNARVRNHVDVWLGTTEQARNWGRCRAEIGLP